MLSKADKHVMKKQLIFPGIRLFFPGETDGFHTLCDLISRRTSAMI